MLKEKNSEIEKLQKQKRESVDGLTKEKETLIA